MTVQTERRGAATLITIDRPGAGNSLNPAVGRGLLVALSSAADDHEVRTVILTGAGKRHFSTGMDLVAFAAGEDMGPVAAAFDALADFPKPVIAAINGAAVGGGLEIMMRCDLVVAAEHAVFGTPEVTRGIVPGGGATRLPRRIPIALALELGLTGESISARRAADLGLVNRVVPAAEVVAVASALASSIAANAPLAVMATKRLMWDELGSVDRDRFRQLVEPVSRSADALEGARAFAEKRPPVWRGR